MDKLTVELTREQAEFLKSKIEEILWSLEKEEEKQGVILSEKSNFIYDIVIAFKAAFAKVERQ